MSVTCHYPPPPIAVAAATAALAPTTERPAMLLPPRRWWLLLPVDATSFAIHLGCRGLVLEYNLVFEYYSLKVRGSNDSLPFYFQGLTQQRLGPLVTVTILGSTGAHQLLATPSPRSADVPPRPNFPHQLVCPLLRKDSPQLCPQLCRSVLGRGVFSHSCRHVRFPRGISTSNA